ncbi:unnamed protein product [Lactuca virosa]|uniref:Uncharacterized protein n=1 Tax=Lactuca virosa TaxID=75947 RepID=A0AAU9LIT3_9ASTR|nr:unnamed protein product [Lactuca virosa]
MSSKGGKRMVKTERLSNKPPTLSSKKSMKIRMPCEATGLHECHVHFNPILATTSDVVVGPTPLVVPPKGLREVAHIQSDVVVVSTTVPPFTGILNFHVDAVKHAFCQKLLGLGFGYGRSKPDVPKATSDPITPVGATPSSKETTEPAIVDTIDLDSLIPSSNHNVIKANVDTTVVNDHTPNKGPSKRIVISSKNEAPQPTLMSYATSLPSFLYPFTTTKFMNKPNLRKLNEEDGIDKARSHPLKGLHWINEEELCQLNLDLQMKIDEARSQKTSMAETLDGLIQQFEGLKVRFTEKVSILDIACFERDVHIKLLKDKLASCKAVMKGNESQIQLLESEKAKSKQDVLFHHLMDELNSVELHWLLKKGVSTFVCASLSLEDSSTMNSSLQTSSI